MESKYPMNIPFDSAKLMMEAADMLAGIRREFNSLNGDKHDYLNAKYDEPVSRLVSRIRDMVPALFEHGGDLEIANKVAEEMKKV